ncbi:hypothetical protein [Actinomadura rupiterrae]|uniref:hypothetical protein n=1 Tax=Actinomadura rupiterrae TaxID=559627 RepID=UPI0020A33984|nr:hypothetical protein [Actinomadura rupiterrae]MCP2336122.1 hypothetical protein [Actinomadura rupiterrae]
MEHFKPCIDFDPVMLSVAQSTGTACVLCRTDYYISDIPHVPVGVSSHGDQVFACETCIPTPAASRMTHRANDRIGQCPAWCELITCAGRHWARIDDWDGPAPRWFEIGITARGDVRPEIVIEAEEWNEYGETVRHCWETLTPLEALATGLLVRGRLGAALLGASARVRIQPWQVTR